MTLRRFSANALKVLSGSVLLALSACGKKSNEAQAEPAAPLVASAPNATPASTGSPKASGGSLKGICPDEIVIQTDWYATPERAAAYQLIGPGGTVDKKKGTYSGPLGKTGVNVQVRLGGPFIGFQPIPALMYQDPSIYLGYVATDDAIQAAEKFPTTAVVAPLDINPQILMWDPATYDIKSWPDVAKSKGKVTYVEGMPFMDYLVAKNLVTKDQLDASFDGTPSRFVAAQGKIIQMAYASNEPYRWEHAVPEWSKPVKYLLIHDSGYDIYPQGVAVRTGQLPEAKACLKELVPMIQQAQLDYMANPTPTNDTLLEIYQTLKDGPPLTKEGNANSTVVMKDLKLVGNGTDDTLGNFDLKRIDATIEKVRPVFAARGTKVSEKLSAKDLVTNEFIDPTKKL